MKFNRESFFNALARFVINDRKKIAIGSVLITIVFLFASMRLSIRTEYSKMMPPGIPQIEEWEKITDQYPNTSTITILLENERGNKEKMIRCASEVTDSLKLITMTKPSANQKFTIVQKILKTIGMKNIKGVQYDTLPMVRRIDWKNDRDFILSHGLMVQKTSDLKNTLSIFSNPDLPYLIRGINNNLEKEYVGNSDNIASLDGENSAVQSLDALYRFILSLDHFSKVRDSSLVASAIGDFLSGEEYIFSPDGKGMLLMVQPAVNGNDLDNLMALGKSITEATKEIQSKYSGTTIRVGGNAVLQNEEMEYGFKNMGILSFFAFALILLLLVGSLGSFRLPFFSIIVLFVSVLWSAGIVALTFRYINMMTSSFALILIGLGIDYAIHFLSGYSDARQDGENEENAIYKMYQKTGSGVATGAFTTAIVFFALILTRFRAVSEMGVVIGTGIIVCFILSATLLPVIILRSEKREGLSGLLNFKNKKTGSKSTFSRFFSMEFLGALGSFVTRPFVAILVLLLSIVSIYISFKSSFNLRYEYNMMELEPIGMPSVIAQDSIIKKFEMSPDFALLTNKTLDEEREKISQFKKVGKRTGLIGMIDGLSEIIPHDTVQLNNKKILKHFSQYMDTLQAKRRLDSVDVETLLSELKRLHDNVVEMGELSLSSKGEKNKIIKKCDLIVGKDDSESHILRVADAIRHMPDKITVFSEYQQYLGPSLINFLKSMADTSMLSVRTIPLTIREKYVNQKDSTFLCSIVARDNIWNEKYLRRFNSETSKVDNRVTGMPMVFQLFMDYMGNKASIAIIIGGIAIFLFLLIDFRSFVYAILASIPLAFGALWMTGMMGVFHMTINMMNIMALPLILGIGIDDAVHILHRYRIEGPGSMKIVLKSTGKAIFLTSLTTGIGFGILAISPHRGMASMGLTLALGVFSCFISSVIILPSILSIIEHFFKRGGKL